MAVHNHVFLYGRVASNPRIYKTETGELLRAICVITTIRGLRENGQGIKNLRYDHITIMTESQSKMKEIETWHENDMVEVKGLLVTSNIRKSHICPNCNHKNKEHGMLFFIHPIYASKREVNVSEEESIRLLKKRCEISNHIELIGNVCDEPIRFKQKSLRVTTYNLGINRRYRIKEDDPEKKADYPWVKSYGKIATNDGLYLQKGTLVLVIGVLQNREANKVFQCEECNEKYMWTERILEVVPYNTEYLQNAVTQERINELKEERHKQILDDLWKEEEES